MATQLTLNELMTTYGDAATQDRLLQLMNLRTILADCIIDKSYRVSEGLHTPLALTPYGTTVAEQVRKKAAPFYESRLLCLLELIGRDLLIDPIQTNITALKNEISKQIKNFSLRLPFRGARVLYDKFAIHHNEERYSLSRVETQELLADTPQGVFQVGKFVTGPYGLLTALESRHLPPTLALPLQHCSDLSCDVVHHVNLSTDHEAEVNEHRSTISKILERHGEMKAWRLFLETFATPASQLLDDTRNEPLLVLAGDAFSDMELRTVLAAILDNDGGKLRPIVSPLGVTGRSEDAVGNLNRAQLLHLLYLATSQDVRQAIDRLVFNGSIHVPTGETRQAVVNKHVLVGPYRLFAELSRRGIRTCASGANIAPLRLRRLIEQMYNLDQTEDREELAWQLREESAEALEEKLRRYVQLHDPREVLERLVLARRSNVIVASERVGFHEELTKNDAELIDSLLWKLGFPLDDYLDPNEHFLKLHDDALLALRQHSVGSEQHFQEKLRSATVNYFVTLEGVLQDSLCYTTWALTCDHVTGDRPFVYREAVDGPAALDMLTRTSQNEDGDHAVSFDEKNSLYALCRGFEILSRALAVAVAEMDSYRRTDERQFRWAGRQSLQRFPFTHTMPIIDIMADSRSFIMTELAGISKTLVAAEISELRNKLLHIRRGATELEQVRSGLETVREVLARLESNGFCRLMYKLSSRTTDAMGRERVLLSHNRGYEAEIYLPSNYEWLGLPPVRRPQYVMTTARVSSDGQVLRFLHEPSSAYAEMWEGFPTRPQFSPSAGAVS